MLNTPGKATFTTSTLAVGTRPITAVFAGTSAYLGSTSPAISQVIQPSATLTVNFTVHALMDNTNKPKVQDVPVANAEIRVYERRDHAPTASSSRATRRSGASCMTALMVRGPFRDARS